VDALPSVNTTLSAWLLPGAMLASVSVCNSPRWHAHVPMKTSRADARRLPGFFASLGVPIVAGRDFNDNDGQKNDPVVIVSETLAQRMFPNQDPSIGMSIGPIPCCNSHPGQRRAAPHHRRNPRY